MGNFKESLERTFKEEGGLSLSKIDRGGATNYGISLKFLRSCGIDLDDLDRDGITLERIGDLNNDGRVDEEDIRLMTKEVAERLYYKYFWNPLKLDLVEPQFLCDQIFDISVNSGAPKAAELLQKAVCHYGIPITVDSQVGMQTLRAIESCSRKSVLNDILLDYRLVNFETIVKNDPTQKGNLKGWKTRASRYYV